MAIDANFAIDVEDLFAGAGPITLRRMFGGAGVYCEGVMFGLVIEGTVYLKTDEGSVGAFEREGSRPFVYETRHRTVTVGAFWSLPERLWDEPEEAVSWARTAIGVARAAAKKKGAKRASRPLK